MSPTSTSRASSQELESVELFRPENRQIKGLGSVRMFIQSTFPTVQVAFRPRIGTRLGDEPLEALASSFASARVKDPNNDTQSFEPLEAERDYEKRVLMGGARVGGIVYDGRVVQRVLSSLLRPTSVRASIVLTDRLLSTFSRDDLRHHLRTVVFGFPSVVSLPGIVEAPAKPREYYLLKQRMELQGAGELQMARMKRSFEGRYLDYGDPRTAEVVKGLVLQAIVFHLTLDPFCDDSSCRLFNAHWQEELVRSQISSAKLCRRHDKLLKALGSHPSISW